MALDYNLAPLIISLRIMESSFTFYLICRKISIHGILKIHQRCNLAILIPIEVCCVARLMGNSIISSATLHSSSLIKIVENYGGNDVERSA